MGAALVHKWEADVFTTLSPIHSMAVRNWIVSSQSHMTVLGDGAFREKIKVIRMGPNPTRWRPYKRERQQGCRYTEKRPCEDRARRIAKPRKEAPRGTKPASTLIWDFQPRDPWEINFRCLSHPDCGILLWQPQLTKTTVYLLIYIFFNVFQKWTVISPHRSYIIYFLFCWYPYFLSILPSIVVKCGTVETVPVDSRGLGRDGSWGKRGTLP